MAGLNLRKFASEVATSEGKKVQTSIGNVREIMKILLTKLANMSSLELEDVLRRYRPRR